MSPNTEKAGWGRMLSLVLLLIISSLQIFPLIWLLANSLNSNADLFVGAILKIPADPRFENYVLAWERGEIPRYFLNSVVVCSLAIAAACYISFTMAYAFSRMEWRGRRLVTAIIMLGIMLPIHITLLPNYLVFTRLGVDTSYLAMLIPYIAFSFPIGTFILTGYLFSVPRSLEESAHLDGCGLLSIIFRIVMPVTKPAMMTVAILTFLTCWNEYIMAATFLNNMALRTLPFSIMKFVGEYGSNYAAQFAVMSLAAFPALVLYLIFSHRITSGIMAGAIRG